MLTFDPAARPFFIVITGSFVLRYNYVIVVLWFSRVYGHMGLRPGHGNAITVVTPPAQFNYTGGVTGSDRFLQAKDHHKLAPIRTTISLVMNNSRACNKYHMVA